MKAQLTVALFLFYMILVRIVIQSILMFFLPALVFDYLGRKNGNPYIGWSGRRVEPRIIFLSVLLIPVSLPLVSFVSDMSREILSLPVFADLGSSSELRDNALKDFYDSLLLDVSPAAYVLNIIALCMVPAVSEEFFFRGIIQNFLCRHIEKRVVAVIFAALIFSLVHFQISEFASRTLLGFIIGYAYLLSGNIWIPVAMHAVNNMLAVILYPYSGQETFITQWWAVLLSVSILLVIFGFVRKQNE